MSKKPKKIVVRKADGEPIVVPARPRAPREDDHKERPRVPRVG